MTNMDDLDAVLNTLAHEPTPPFDDMQARVFARVVAARPAAGPGMRIELLAIGAALAMGVAGAGFTAHPARAEASLAPLGGQTPLAPSRLLIDAP